MGVEKGCQGAGKADTALLALIYLLSKSATHLTIMNFAFSFNNLIAKDPDKLGQLYQLDDASAIFNAYRMLCTPFKTVKERNVIAYNINIRFLTLP